MFKSCKNLIFKANFTNLFLYLFYEIHFWRIRRDKNKIIFWGIFSDFCFMPCGTIATKENYIISVFRR